MSLAQKLILFALAVALLPMAVTGFALVRVSETALRHSLADEQMAAAAAIAGQVSQAVDELASRLATVMEVVEVRDLSAEERQGLLRLLYRQAPNTSAAALLDPQGRILAPPVYFEPGAAAGTDLAAHPSLTRAELDTFLARVPRGPGGLGSAVSSPVYFATNKEPRLALAVPCCLGSDGQPAAWAGVEIALWPETLRLEGVPLTGAKVFVIDKRGAVILHPDRKPGESMLDHGAVASFVEGRRGTREYPQAGQTWLGAFAPVGGLGWGVVVERPAKLAYASADAMRKSTLIWLSVTALVVAGLAVAFAGHIRRLLGRLMTGARAFASRRFAERIAVVAQDEIGELAGTMNGMAQDLERSLRELDDWSKNLERRVEDRTNELKEAQAQLLMQSKLAAIGQLGAGVAHEVNNPLAGILGYAQLLLRKHPAGDPDHESLKRIEDAAKRCKEITLGLLRFSERGLAGRQAVNANEVVRQVVEVVEGSLGESKIVVVQELDANLPTGHADPGQLAIVLMNLINNARAAMPDGGTLTVRTALAGEGQVRFEVIDTGIGIAPEHMPRIFEPFFTTKKVWTAAGLGLSVAYRIVADHGGRIDLQSEVGKGTHFTVILPLEPPAPQVDRPPTRPTLLA